MRKLENILDEQNRPDDRDLRSRSDQKRERRETEERLARLARELVTLSRKNLEGLGLPEPVFDAAADAQTIRSAIARDRQLRIVRRTLRVADADAIDARLRALLEPDGQKARRARVAEHWSQRLVEEGDTALDEFLTAFPYGDRTRLRQAVRAASAGRKPTGRRRLTALVLETIARPPEPAGPPSSRTG